MQLKIIRTPNLITIETQIKELEQNMDILDIKTDIIKEYGTSIYVVLVVYKKRSIR